MGYVLSDAQRFAVGIKIVLDEDALPRGGNFTMSGLVGLVEQLTSYQADERGRHRLRRWYAICWPRKSATAALSINWPSGCR